MKIVLFFMILFLCGGLVFSNGYSWGPTGHRVVGVVAASHLSKKAKRNIRKLLHGKSLAFVSTFADEIKSDQRYRIFNTWHYVNIASHKKYGEEPPNPDGDLVQGIEKCMAIIKDRKASDEDKAFYLKLLIHLIGDLHQPLHVGHAQDKGGNTIQAQWFKKGSNLHRIWDNDMIAHYGMSYTELADNLPSISRKQKKAIQRGTLMDWVYESQKVAEKVYASMEKGESLGYGYMYDHFDIVEQQLQKGGLRLAGMLNALF